MEIKGTTKFNEVGDIIKSWKNEKGNNTLNLSALQRSFNKNLLDKNKELKKEIVILRKEIIEIKSILENHNLRVDYPYEV